MQIEMDLLYGSGKQPRPVLILSLTHVYPSRRCTLALVDFNGSLMKLLAASFDNQPLLIMNPRSVYAS